MASDTASYVYTVYFLWSDNVQALAGSATACLNRPINRFHTGCNLAVLQPSLRETNTLAVYYVGRLSFKTARLISEGHDAPCVTWKKQTQRSPLSPTQPRTESVQRRFVKPCCFFSGQAAKTYPSQPGSCWWGSPREGACPSRHASGFPGRGAPAWAGVCVCVLVSLGGGTSLDGSNTTALWSSLWASFPSPRPLLSRRARLKRKKKSNKILLLYTARTEKLWYAEFCTASSYLSVVPIYTHIYVCSHVWM